MWKFIEQLRQQPKPIRQTAAFWGAVLFSLLIVGVWSLSLPDRLMAVIQFSEEQTFEPPSQMLSSMRDLSENLRAAVVGRGAAPPPNPTSSATTSRQLQAYEIDLRELSQSSTTATSAPHTTTPAGVWAREYEERSGGRPILIATTSRSTTTQSEE